jgi:hypothetical protein
MSDTIERSRAQLAEEIRSLTGQLPITELDERDIFLVGFPKSGSTWMQNLAAGVLYGIDPELTPDSLIQELVPDVAYKRYYKRFSIPMVFKSHELPRPDYRRVIYLLRDGRDAMVSQWHCHSALMGKSLEELNFLAQVEAGNPWSNHVEAWLANPYDAAILTIRYEHLLAGATVELRRFCDFAGIERSGEFLHAITGKVSFEKMRRKELQSGWDNPAWPTDRAFIRRGIAGSYKDEMPPDVLAAFMQRGGPTLLKCGYL